MPFIYSFVRTEYRKPFKSNQKLVHVLNFRRACAVTVLDNFRLGKWFYGVFFGVHGRKGQDFSFIFDLKGNFSFFFTTFSPIFEEILKKLFENPHESRPFSICSSPDSSDMWHNNSTRSIHVYGSSCAHRFTVKCLIFFSVRYLCCSILCWRTNFLSYHFACVFNRLCCVWVWFDACVGGCHFQCLESCE